MAVCQALSALFEADAERNAFGELLAALPQERARRAVVGEDALVEGGAEVRDGALARREGTERGQR